ncbi:hypothetical protein OC834_006315 [Tilletia horrida]|nr:hypothetical protein OC834_006315 [Tilletia horrida]
MPANPRYADFPSEGDYPSPPDPPTVKQGRDIVVQVRRSHVSTRRERDLLLAEGRRAALAAGASAGSELAAPSRREGTSARPSVPLADANVKTEEKRSKTKKDDSPPRMSRHHLYIPPKITLSSSPPPDRSNAAPSSDAVGGVPNPWAAPFSPTPTRFSDLRSAHAVLSPADAVESLAGSEHGVSSSSSDGEVAAAMAKQELIVGVRRIRENAAAEEAQSQRPLYLDPHGYFVSEPPSDFYIASSDPDPPRTTCLHQPRVTPSTECVPEEGSETDYHLSSDPIFAAMEGQL